MLSYFVINYAQKNNNQPTKKKTPNKQTCTMHKFYLNLVNLKVSSKKWQATMQPYITSQSSCVNQVVTQSSLD